MSTTELANLEMELIRIIETSLPNIQSDKKYGGLLFKSGKEGKHFCGVFVYKNHVTIEFGDGYKLDDPTGALAGKGKYRRNLKFTSLEDIDRDLLKGFLVQAYELASTK